MGLPFSPVRILQVLFTDTIGGAESLAYALNESFREAGHESDIVLLDPSGMATGELARLRRMRKTLRQRRPDIVVAHSALPIVYSVAVCRSRFPMVAVLHSASDDYAVKKLRVAQQFLTRYIDHTIAVSDSQAQVYLSRFGARANPLSVIENGIDTGRFRGSRSELAERSIRFLTATRLVRFKRIDVAIRALTLLSQAQIKATLSVLGSGDPIYEGELREAAKAVDSEYVTVDFLGDRSDVDSVMSDHDVLIHCSSTEGFSVALVEAAASGMPLVLSDALIPVPSGATIRRFSDGDPTSLAALLSEIADEPAPLLAAAEEAAPLIRQRYSIDECARRYLRVLQDVLGPVPDRIG
jgi:L-malate glycosyltransferase